MTVELAGGSHLLLHVKTTSAAMLQVMAQIQAGIGVMAKPEPDGSWSIFIHGGYGGLQRVLDDSDFVAMDVLPFSTWKP